MTDDITALRAAIAERATSGPWHTIAVGDEAKHFAVAGTDDVSLLTVIIECDVGFAAVYNKEDADYIATASPDRITRVLDALEALDAAPVAPAVPAGWALVPVELTEVMTVIGANTINDNGGNARWPDVREAWAEMLAAAPQPTPAADAAAVPSAEPVAPTDAQILAAARALNKLNAEACNVDESDSWKLYGNSHIIDASVILRAALGIGAAREQA